MENWTIIRIFTFPHEAHMAKLYLESLGISVILNHEISTQVINYNSNTIGGVRLLVPEGQVEEAKGILLEGGYTE